MFIMLAVLSISAAVATGLSALDDFSRRNWGPAVIGSVLTVLNLLMFVVTATGALMGQ